MPPTCIYPGCGLKAKRYNPESFHELPFRYNDQELLQQWLIALKIDITTPIDTLMMKHYRVCSRHFDKDDFFQPPKAKDPKKQHRVRLKRNAVPRVEESASTGLKESESTAVPQFTLKKSSQKHKSARRSDLPSVLRLTVSSSDQTSLPSTYLARPPVLTLKEETDTKMSEICIIEGCNRTVELLSFPKDPSTLQQWLLCLNGRLKHPVNASSTVCSAHFTPDCFISWQQKQSGVADNLIPKAGDLPSHFAEVCNEQVDPWSQEEVGVGGQCDPQQTLVMEDTGVPQSTPPYTQSRATQTPAATHVSLGDGLAFLLHPAKVVTVQRDHCSVHTSVWTAGFPSHRNSPNMHGRNALMSDIMVKLACLLQLFQRCLKCCSESCSVSVKRKGPIIHVLQRCWSCGNIREWTNQQESFKPPVQPPPDPTNSLEANEEPVVTSEDLEDEITVKIEEEEEEEEELEEEIEVEAEMEEEDMTSEEEEGVETDKEVTEEVEQVETDEEEKEDEEVEMEEEEEEEVTEEKEEEEENQKPKKRKRRDNDEEWAPDDEAGTETSDEESEEEEEEEDEDDEEESPHRWTWCCDCGVKPNTGCIRQKHILVYCCKMCGYRDGYQEPKNTELQVTQRISCPETPSAGHQEGTGDVTQADEGSCSPEDDGNNKTTASSDSPEDQESIPSQGVITDACQHATNSGIDKTFDNSDEASTCSRYDNSKASCTRRKRATDQGVSASQLGSNNNQEEASSEKQNIPIYAVFFEELCDLKSHMRLSHAGKRHLCPDCGVFCTIRNGKSSHVCNHKVKPFPCLSCGRRFSSEARLQLHIQFHNEDYTTKCQYCHETFKQKEDKQRHEETHNGEKLKFRCPECPKRLANGNTRKAHLSTAHFKRGRFVCKVCDKSFHVEFHLKRHKVVHTGVKPYVCEQCNRSFNQASHLKSHMRVHTGEKPFLCHECGLSFNHNVSLKNHVQRKHAAASDGDDG